MVPLMLPMFQSAAREERDGRRRALYILPGTVRPVRWTAISALLLSSHLCFAAPGENSPPEELQKDSRGSLFRGDVLPFYSGTAGHLYLKTSPATSPYAGSPPYETRVELLSMAGLGVMSSCEQEEFPSLPLCRFQFALLANLGDKRAIGEKFRDNASLHLLPGENFHLLIGLKKREREKGRGIALVMGRLNPLRILRNGPGESFDGGGGSLTGLHLLLLDNREAALLITPLHFPLLRGQFAGPEPSRPDPGLLRRKTDQWQTGLIRTREEKSPVGHSLQFQYGSEKLFLELHYERILWEASPAYAGEAPWPRNHIDYAGGTFRTRFETENFDFTFRLSLERSMGSYRLPHRSFGKQSGTVDGYMLFSGIELQRGASRLFLNLYLPEPSHDADESEEKKTGYTGYGDTPLPTPLLSGVLDSRPTPEICTEPICYRDLLFNPAMPRFKNHAALTSLGYEFRRGPFRLRASALLMKPLKKRNERKKGPFGTLTPSPELPEYREFTVELRHSFRRGFSAHLLYSCLYEHGGKEEGGGRLLGETLSMGLRIHLTDLAHPAPLPTKGDTPNHE